MVRRKALFDTNILIDYLSGIPQARLEMERYSQRAISIITWMEVMAGTTRVDERQIRAFLLTFSILPVTAEIAEQAFDLRRQRKIKLPDAIILATAQVEDRLFITRNTRDFPGIDPNIRIPYRL
ncbi:MAG: type II toxin-antitoxin system VapC family toxin [Terracidiphilus sp.]|jgi:predicted nucleic acid-binding protein